VGVPLFETETPGFFSDAPHQVTVDPRDGSAWYTGFHSGNVYKIAADGTLLAVIQGFDRPVSVSVEARDGSVWVAAFSVETPGAVVKLSSEGEIIQRVVLDAPPHIAAVDPYDGSIWVGISGALVKLDGNGGIMRMLPGYTMPKSIAFTDSRGEFTAKLKCIFHSLTE
jgi:DNA-binding beta-propeller fold protein YncE